MLCKASSEITEYLHDLLAGERDENAYKCMFLIDGVGADYIDVRDSRLRGIDRIVPLGQAMTFEPTCSSQRISCTA